uniref:Glyco_trans_2-like domain-containing protein n=1 Tax=Syphacia muris TaxID=451379 RepID=A0A0N5AAZ0_9BILA
MVVSCIVPVRNGGCWLEKCLESILLFEVSSDIIIQVSVYNDGSNDNTDSILQLYKQLFYEKNVEFIATAGNITNGVGYAKNRAVEQSTGDYLCFCDADDVFTPLRIKSQLNAALNSKNPSLAFIGGKFVREPCNSTYRYAKWANSLSEEELYTEIYTSHGPTLIAPTWFFSRELFNKVGGFKELEAVGYPEDLRFFYDAVKHGAILIRVDECVTIYRYHMECASLKVSEAIIWSVRVEEISENVISKWKSFTIWNAGKEGKRFYKLEFFVLSDFFDRNFRSLSCEDQKKVIAFCDVDVKKIDRGYYENYDCVARIVTAKVPIISVSAVLPPVIICVKMDLSGGVFEQLLREKKWREGVDYFHFN